MRHVPPQPLPHNLLLPLAVFLALAEPRLPREVNAEPVEQRLQVALLGVARIVEPGRHALDGLGDDLAAKPILLGELDRLELVEGNEVAVVEELRPPDG